jgi:hypothetical protein
VYNEIAYRKVADQSKEFSTFIERIKLQSLQWTGIVRSRMIKNVPDLFFGAGITFTFGLPDEYGIEDIDTGSYNVLGKQARIGSAFILNAGYKIGSHGIADFRYEYGRSSPDFKELEYFIKSNGHSSFIIAYAYKF